MSLILGEEKKGAFRHNVHKTMSSYSEKAETLSPAPSTNSLFTIGVISQRAVLAQAHLDYLCRDSYIHHQELQIKFLHTVIKHDGEHVSKFLKAGLVQSLVKTGTKNFLHERR